MIFTYIGVFVDNLSVVYVFTILSSLLVIFITYKYTQQRNAISCQSQEQKCLDSDSNFQLTDEEEISNDELSLNDEMNENALKLSNGIPGQVKRARQKATEQKILENMTEQDKDKEKEVQKRQLEEIFNLMQQNEEKFGPSSSEDIAEQMRLYT